MAWVAQVVPDLPTFAVDDGFGYLVPEDMALSVGSLVRVPLGGRRVRGYVVDLRPSTTNARLKPIAAVSGDRPVFSSQLAQTLRWAAIHYVAPVSVVLRKAAPPNVPRTPAAAELGDWRPSPTSPLPDLTAAARTGRFARPEYLAVPVTGDLIAGVAGDILPTGAVLVACPTVTEAAALASALEGWFGDRVVRAWSQLGAKALTAAWGRAASTPGVVVVGTRETALWPIADLRLAVLVEDGRRGHKDRQTPTVHAREVLRKRAAVERFGLAYAGPVPTTEALATGAHVITEKDRTRSWPLVEVVDRSEDPPGSGFVTSRARAALAAVARRGGRGFVFTHYRGYAPAYRCTACRTLRACTRCEARLGRSDACDRCGTPAPACRRCDGKQFEPLGAGVERILEELRPLLGETVSAAAGPGRIWIGTERDLAGVGGLDVAVVIDADGLIRAPSYRAEEDALRTMARVASTVNRGRGKRCVIQTSTPDHEVITALRRGEPLPLLRAQLKERERLGLPPAGEVLILEITDPASTTAADLAEIMGGAEAFGPVVVGDRARWLLQGQDLSRARIGLRRVVQQWRDGGSRVRVDADPLEL